MQSVPHGRKACWWVTGPRCFLNRTCVFQLGGKRSGNVRKFSLSFTSYPDSQTDKTVLGADFFLSPGHSPQTLGKGGTSNWKALGLCCSWCWSLHGRARPPQEGIECPDAGNWVGSLALVSLSGSGEEQLPKKRYARLIGPDLSIQTQIPSPAPGLLLPSKSSDRVSSEAPEPEKRPLTRSLTESMASGNPAAMRAVIQEEEEGVPPPNYITHCPPDFNEMKEEAARHSELQWKVYFNHRINGIHGVGYQQYNGTAHSPSLHGFCCFLIFFLWERELEDLSLWHLL